MYQQNMEQREKYIKSLPTLAGSSWKLSTVPEPLSINITIFEKALRKLTLAHLLEATNGFNANSLIGSRSFGGTSGYVLPEYYQSFRCTTKKDVYNYGVILLEHLSGKRSIDPFEFGDDNNLVGGWAKQLQREQRSNEILGPELLLEKFSDSELHHYLKIAFDCLDDRPFRRPTMIQSQVDSENDRLDGFSLKQIVIEESWKEENMIITEGFRLNCLLLFPVTVLIAWQVAAKFDLNSELNVNFTRVFHNYFSRMISTN